VNNDNKLIRKRQEYLVSMSLKAPLVQTFGMKLSYNNAGQAVWEMPYNPKLDHAAGGIHGGVFATLLDNAGWFTVAPNFENWISTIEYQTRLLEPVEHEHLKAIGEIVRLGKRITIAQMKLWSGSGKLVAIGSGSFTTTNVALPV
jgi:uncharacterized protein (TIGR00369 family)